MDCIYVRCLGEEEEERYEENNVTSKCQIRRDLPLDEKILERLVVSPPSQHRRHIFSRILANRVINKVNSAPLVYKRQSSRPKPRSNAPSDVSRLGDL